MKRRFWVLFLIILIVFCSFLYKAFYDEAKERAINSLNEQQRLHARQAALGIEDYLSNMTNSLNSISRSEDIATLSLSGKKLMEAFYETHKERIQTFIRVAPNGRIIYSIPYKEFIGNDIWRQKHVQEIMSTHKPVVSDVFRAVQGLDVVAVHVPVFKKGRYDGTIGIGINFQVIAQRYLEGIQIGKTGYSWMISRDGTELYCPIPGHTGKTVFENCKDFPSILAMAEEMVKGREGVTTYVFDRVRGQVVEGVRKHAVYMPVKVGNTFWSIVVASSEEEVLSSLADFRNRLFWIIGLILLGGSLVSFYGLKAVFIVQEEQKRKHVEEALQKSEEQARQLAQENSIMAEIGRIISSTLNIDEVYALFSAKVKTLLPYDRIAVNLINNDGTTLVNRYLEGNPAPGRNLGEVFPVAGTITGAMIQSRAGSIIDSQNEDEMATKYAGLLPEFKAGFRSFLSIPLISRDKVIGGLHFRSKRFRSYSEKDLKLAQSIASQIAGAIANAQLYGRLSETEESLRRSEERFRDLYDHAPVGYHEYDAEGRITSVNRTELEMLGYTAEEMIGQYMWKFNIEGEVARERILAKLAGTLPPDSNLDRTYRRKNGSTFPALCQDRPILDKGGRIRGIRCVIQDITERKRAEEALRESEERFRAFIDNSPTVAWAKDEQGCYVYLSRTYEERFGVRLEDWRGKTDFELWALDIAQGFWKIDQAVLATGRMIEVEVHTRNADGSYCTWWNFKFPFQDALGRRYVGGVGMDITERKRAEENLRKSEARFQELFDEAPVGYHEYDTEGRIIQINRTELMMLGYAREEMMGQPIWNFVEEREESEKEVKAKLAGTIPAAQHLERTFRRKDGTTFPVLIQNRILRNSEGRITGIRTTLQDVSERKKVETEAKRLAHEDSVLAEIGRIISSTLNIEEVYKAFAEKVRELIGFDRIAIGLINAEENVARFPYIEGTVVPGREPGDILPLAGTAIEKAFQARVGMIIAMESEKEIAATVPGLLPEFRCGIRSALTVPLISGDRVIGALVLRSTIPGIYTKRHLKLVESIGNQIAGAIANSQLFAERKNTQKALQENKERLDLALRSAHMGVWHWDILENKRYFDGQVCSLFGIDPATFTGGAEEFFRVVHPEDRDVIRSALARTLDQDVPYESEYRVVWRDGSIHYITGRGRLARDNEGRPARINGIIWDITERKRAEEEKERLENQLFQAQKMEAIGTLAGGIAHDFNNILSAILGYAELASLDLKEESKVRYNLEHSMKAAHRAKDLVEQILAFSRQGRQERKPLHIESDRQRGAKVSASNIANHHKGSPRYRGGFGSD